MNHVTTLKLILTKPHYHIIIIIILITILQSPTRRKQVYYKVGI